MNSLRILWMLPELKIKIPLCWNQLPSLRKSNNYYKKKKGLKMQQLAHPKRLLRAKINMKKVPTVTFYSPFNDDSSAP